MIQILAVFTIIVTFVSGFTLEDIADGSSPLLDLSLEYTEDIPYWPSIETKGENFKIRDTQRGYTDLFRYYFHATVFSTSDHGGTHVDALNHVNRNPVNDDIGQIPLEKFFGPAVVIDITDKCRSNRDYELSVDDVKNWESKYGKIPNGSLLFIYTGWGAKINNKTDFWGTEDYFNQSKLHYPGVSGQAAEWIAKARYIKMIGVETVSVDSGQQGLALPAHVAFLTAGIYVIESVQNLQQMPPTGAYVFGLPMKIKGASGSPVRLVAVGWNK